jgi:hypothetical protein
MTMTRISTSLPIVAVGLAAAVLIVVGCGTRPTPSTVGPVPVSDTTPESKSEKPSKLFANWPTPVGALIISGEQIGFLEPCGCSAGQKGGLARRLDLIDKLRSQGWPLALIDLGSLANEDLRHHGGPQEAKIRFNYAIKALEIMKYSAVALSATDLKLGVGDVVNQFMNMGDQPKIVAANIVPDKALMLEGKFVPSVRTEVGPIKVGITAVLAPEAFDALRDPDKSFMLTKTDPDDSLKTVLADLEKDTQFQVLMVQGPADAARTYAKAHPGFEIVVATSPFVDPPKDAETVNDGKTQIISVGKKGQYVGVLGLFQDPKLNFRYQRMELGSRLNSKTEAMRKLIDEDFQEELQRSGVLESYPRLTYFFGDAPSDSTYVGAESCKNCHPNTFTKWANTKHAHAYEALTENPKRNREFDADCVSCHTTGFEYKGGFVTAEKTPNLKGNQCENCHGPGSKHAAEPDNKDYRKAVARNSTDFDKNHRCIECHTEDDSPKFDFSTYYSKIVHKGLDRYDDPRVHQAFGAQTAEKAR